MVWSDAPKGRDRISDSQSPMRINFTDFETAFEINHRDLGDALQGVHDKIDFVSIKIANIGTVLDDEILVFNHFSSNEDKLRIKKGSADDYAITRSSKKSTDLTSGLLLKYGSFQITETINDLDTVTVPVVFGGEFTQIPYAVIISPGLRSTTVESWVSYTSLTTTGFTAKARFDNSGQQINFPFYYTAIGI